MILFFSTSFSLFWIFIKKINFIHFNFILICFLNKNTVLVLFIIFYRYIGFFFLLILSPNILFHFF